jgi:hypothetical protein
MNPKIIAKHYNSVFKRYAEQAPLTGTDNWLLGTWMIGNNYRNKKKYHGEYPPGYLDRVLSMFPDVKSRDILHVFSGSLDEETPGDRFDINPDLNTTYCGNAEQLSRIVDKKYKLILADPPYSEEDALKYGVPMVNRNKVVSECVKILELGGCLVWLDQVFPMYRKKELRLFGTIGVVRSTNHRTRMVFMWEKVGEST